MSEESEPKVESELVKSKKSRSPAQIDAFAKARAVRHERLRNLNKPAPVEDEVKPKAPKSKPKKAPVIIEEESEEDEPQQIIIRRKKPAKKPLIVYEDSESEEEEEASSKPSRQVRGSRQEVRQPKPKSQPPQPAPLPRADTCGMVFL